MNKLIDIIRQSVIGDGISIKTPFGNKPLVYADYTASGRSLSFIEDFIRRQVLPYYANTHTESSFTGAQTTALREQARREIHRSVNAGEDHKVIFCGSGATSAIHKLLDILNLRLPADLSDRCSLQEYVPKNERPIVFVGPYEHHSNELPWRESIAEMVPIPLTSDGIMDLQALEKNLQRYNKRPIKIGSFSAASNVTGLKTDVDAVTRILHRYDALAFWDYAAAGPYVTIDMMGDRNSSGDSSLDAAFISPHKFIGGPGTPGILVVKQKLLNNRVPTVPAGGTVIYVTPHDHSYIDDAERREEGGTPAIIESIRAGLVFKLQQSVGIKEIRRHEESFIQRALQRLDNQPNIEILGNTQAPRLSIFSFRIKHKGKDLHYGFVVALLNDLFGIQARGGCSCAGPYGHTLLGMNIAYSKALEAQILEGHQVLRPGWVRLNFNYFIDEETFEYLIRALELIAQHGWRLLPYYNFDQSTGIWRYQDQSTAFASSLTALDFNDLPSTYAPNDKSLNLPLARYLEIAEEQLCKETRSGEIYSLDMPKTADRLRWFVLPQEVAV